MSDHCNHRCEQLLRQLHEEDYDALLVTSEVNVRYLTGFTGDSSYLILSTDRTLLVSDGRYATQLRDECPGLETHIRPPGQTLQQAVGEVLPKMDIRSISFDSDDLTVAQLEKMKEATGAMAWMGETGRVEKLRAVKDETELDQIKTAIAMAERAYDMFRAMLRGKNSEKELADDLELYIRRAGGQSSSFPPIVAAGPRGALPHAQPTEHILADEDVLLVDWGASAPSAYKSDLTRVFFRTTKSFSSKYNHDPRKVYDVVLRAQKKAIAALRPGVSGAEVDRAARSVIEEAGFADYFNHSIGHGLGLQVHEAPLMRPGSDLKIQSGNVVTIEPGVYLPDQFGIRIEDDVLVTDDGPQVLTRVAKEFEQQIVDW